MSSALLYIVVTLCLGCLSEATSFTKTLDTSETITSHKEYPSFTVSYGDNNKYRYIVNAKSPGTSAIQVVFDATFNVQEEKDCSMDSVNIYSEPLPASVKECDPGNRKLPSFVADYCGDESPGTVNVKLGKGSALTVEFCTDGSNWNERNRYYEGFKISFNEVVQAEPGGDCSNGQKCPSGTACDGKICTCNKPTKLNTATKTCEEMSVPNGECKEKLCPEKTTCIKDICECDKPLAYNEGAQDCVAFAKPGGSCGPELCPNGTTCKSGKCQCNPPTVLDEKNSKCVEQELSEPGGDCSNGQKCPNGTTCDGKICTCNKPTKLDTAMKTCKEMSVPNGECKEKLCPEKTTCIKDICECDKPLMYNEDTKDCVAVAKPGGPCKPELCPDGTTCKKGICQCNPPTVLDEKNSKCVSQAEPGGDCSKGQKCPNGTTCDGKICTCNKPTKLDTATNTCKEMSVPNGECKEKLCPKKTTCFKDICECDKPLAYNEDTKDCVAVAKPGGPCGPELCPDGTTCKKGICQCNPPTVLDEKNSECIATTTTPQPMTTQEGIIQEIYFDLVMLMDESRSLNRRKYELEKGYAKRFVERISDGSLHFSAYEFGSHVKSGGSEFFSLDVDQDTDSITDRIGKFKFNAVTTGTATPDALKAAKEELDNNSRAKTDDKVRKAIVVLTDGVPLIKRKTLKYARELTAELAEKYRSEGISILAIGIGAGAKVKNMKDMTGHEKLIIKAKNFKKMDEQLDPLISRLQVCYKCLIEKSANTCDDDVCIEMLP